MSRCVGNIISGSKQLGAVEQESYGAVVLAGDLHVFAEGALLDAHAVGGYKSGYFFVKFLGQRRFGCGGEAGAASLSAVTVEGEIADEQNHAANVEHAAIHLAGLVGEDAQVYELVGYELRIVQRVTFADAEIDEQTLVDFAHLLIINSDLGLQNSLANDSHSRFLVICVIRVIRVIRGSKPRR